MEWSYLGDIIPTDCFGFCYCIHYTDGTKYIGKKNMYSYLKKPLGKKELALVTDKRLKKYKVVEKESDWKTYNGSCKLSEGKTIAHKEILCFCKTKVDLTYMETKLLMEHNVLFDNTYLNMNVGGTYFAGTLTGSKQYIKD